jgi:hypothetical protein
LDYLCEFFRGNSGVDTRVARCQQGRADGLPVSQVCSIDIGLRVLCKSKQKHSAVPRSKCNHGPISSTSALATTADTLLDQTAAQIGIKETGSRSPDRLSQGLVVHLLFALKSPKGLCDKDPHKQTL